MKHLAFTYQIALYTYEAVPHMYGIYVGCMYLCYTSLAEATTRSPPSPNNHANCFFDQKFPNNNHWALNFVSIHKFLPVFDFAPAVHSK